MYNTETATALAKYTAPYNCGDFNRYVEVLYKTKKGAYFLEGEGGPMSKYAQSYGNGWSGGSGIIAISADEAFEWLQSKDFIDVAEKEFPDKIEEA